MQSKAVTFEFKEAKGDDGDTLGQALIWVYDTAQFPFQQAENYHQFHDDYILPKGDYPASYERLREVFLCSGRSKPTGCRNDNAAYWSSLDCSQMGASGNPDTSTVKIGGSGGDSLSSEKTGGSTVSSSSCALTAAPVGLVMVLPVLS